MKFRLIDRGKIVGYLEYKQYLLNHGISFMGFQWKKIDNPDWCKNNNILHDKSDRYTGFKIKNKEIYENDKLHSNYYGTLIVKCDRDGKWIAECKDKGLGLNDDLWRAVGTCKLIGNIHE